MTRAHSYPRFWPKLVDENGRYHGYTPNLEPLTPQHRAWPYMSPEFPTLVDAEGLTPVGVLIGVLTTDDNAKRRQLIRSTYGSHPNSREPGTEAVSIVFVLGQPRQVYASQVADEAEEYGDIVILDIDENMNNGKTYAFFAWAAQHAQVPSCGKESCDGFRKPDWVVKSDDDAFWVLSQLEKRLRVLPGTKTYWGRICRRGWDWLEFMQGGGYALSMDLVQAIATSEYALNHADWHEDQRASDWMRNIPGADEIIWVTESCWMYDHPKSDRAISIGFVFPDLVQDIRDGINSDVPSYLTGHYHDAWSTVVPLNKVYQPPALVNLTAAREAEGLIEGSPLSLFHMHNRQYTSSMMTGRRQLSKEILADEEERAWSKRKSLSERMRGTIDSTVQVHAVKEDEWWAETALALLGQEVL